MPLPKIKIHVPCAGPEQIPMLFATLASLQAQVPHNCFVAVSYNQADASAFDVVNDGHGIETWTQLFEGNFSITCRPDMSVAQMYADAAKLAHEEGYTFFLKVDCDCLFSNLFEFLIWLSGPNLRADYATFNFWDIVNHRKYDDYFSTVSYLELAVMLERFGERTVWCHRWQNAPLDATMLYSSDTKVNASMFAVRLETLVERGVLDKLNDIKVGQRGMDLCVSSHIGDRRRHFFRTYAYHLGVFRPQLDGRYWNSFQTGAEIPHSELIS